MTVTTAKWILVGFYAVCGAFIGATMASINKTDKEIEETRKRMETIRKIYIG